MMKRTYQLPETETIALSMDTSFMTISGNDENGNTIIHDGVSILIITTYGHKRCIH